MTSSTLAAEAAHEHHDPSTSLNEGADSQYFSGARFLRRATAAAYIQRTWGIACSRAYLAKLAVVGGGPNFHLSGRYPLYTRHDLDVWASSKISSRSFRNTGEYKRHSSLKAASCLDRANRANPDT
jgi:hypothetical protein